MKRVVLLGAAAFVVWCGFWAGTFELAKALGFNIQTTSQYGFTSGVGPMILTGIGMSTIVGSIWHAANCHVEGCWNIGRHKVNGSPYCNDHHEKARHEKTVEQLLAEQNELLREQNELLRRNGADNAQLGS